MKPKHIAAMKRVRATAAAWRAGKIDAQTAIQHIDNIMPIYPTDAMIDRLDESPILATIGPPPDRNAV